MQICVLIRVFDRIEDLRNNLLVIRETWKNFNYYIVVVSNGKSFGYELTDDIYKLSDKVIEIEHNAGHLKGNSQLLLEGVNNIKIEDFKNVIILEADTWIYSDEIIKKYIRLLDFSEAVWASARWYDRFYSLATDFAIIKAEFLKENTNIFDFSSYPECSVCNYLIDNNCSYLLIKENMNVMVPSYMKRYPYAPKGRFYIFPASRMVTHHVEELSKGIEEKKFFFNVIAKKDFFYTKFKRRKRDLVKIYIAFYLDKIFLRRSWYSKRTRMVI